MSISNMNLSERMKLASTIKQLNRRISDTEFELAQLEARKIMLQRQLKKKCKDLSKKISKLGRD